MSSLPEIAYRKPKHQNLLRKCEKYVKLQNDTTKWRTRTIPLKQPGVVQFKLDTANTEE